MATRTADIGKVVDAFSTRLELACGMAEVPTRGRQAWLRRRLAEAGAVVSAQAVNRWFKGVAMPTRGKENAVAAALNVSAAWLFARTADEPMAVEPGGTPAKVAERGREIPSFAHLLMNAPFDDSDIPPRSSVPLREIEF